MDYTTNGLTTDDLRNAALNNTIHWTTANATITALNDDWTTTYVDTTGYDQDGWVQHQGTITTPNVWEEWATTTNAEPIIRDFTWEPLTRNYVDLNNTIRFRREPLRFEDFVRTYTVDMPAEEETWDSNELSEFLSRFKITKEGGS